MSYGRYQTAQVQNAIGQVLAGVQVYFLTQPADVSSLTPLATVYSGPDGGTVTQPLMTDGLGEFVAYLAPGVYTVVYVVPSSGTYSYPDQNIAVGGGTPGSTTFDQIGSGTNTTAAMVVGSGASLQPSGSGVVGATSIGGVTVTGTPGTGQVIKATSPTAATWQTDSGGGGVASLNALTGALTIAVGAGLSISASGSTITISIATAFSITSFTGQSGAVETGFSFTNPSFSASYSVTPASAQITNTDGTDSPFALTAPFTSATITGTFTLAASGDTVTFTLSATQGTTQTASLTTTAADRIFNGIGTSGGATGATASGTSAVLVGDTGTLPSFQLGAETVGTTFVYTGLTGQYIYMLLIGGSHTFVDANTGFPFAVNAPTSITFVNQYGASIPMFLYQSINPLIGAFSPRVAT